MRLSDDIQDLLDNIIDSFIKWDLIMYIHKNPSDHISAEQIARSIGRTSEEVVIALEQLALCRVLEFEDDGEAIYYRYYPSKELQATLTTFITRSMDRNTRWLILNYLIERNGFDKVG